jgi:hypothetical protein
MFCKGPFATHFPGAQDFIFNVNENGDITAQIASKPQTKNVKPSKTSQNHRKFL